MTSSSNGPPRAVAGVATVVGALAVLLLLLADRYGPHRDELYFAAAGRHPAWGYPDQPALTPLLARLTQSVDPHDLVLLRLPSVVAMCALVVMTAAFTRLLGGGRPAQVLAAVTVAVSDLTLLLGHLLSTATLDTTLWTAILLVVARALVRDRPRLWLLAGLLAGVGLNNKHAVVFVLLGVLAGVAVVRETRGQLRTPYPWLGGAVALLLWLPNLLWQAHHGWPVFVLSGEIADEYGGLGGRVGLVAQALVMFSPGVAVLWLYGLVQLLRRPEWVRARPVAVAFLTVTLVFLVTGGKGYYVAGAVPPLVAAGSTALAQRWHGRRLVTAGAVLALTAVVAWPAMLPLLPVRTYAASFYPAIDDNQVETIGWPEYVAEVRRTLDALPADQRRTAVIFTGNYGEAGALQWYGVGRPVYSGHNGWSAWEPPPGAVGPVVVVGLDHPVEEFTGCRRAGTLTNREEADNEERGKGVQVCAAPRGSWAQQWPRLSHLDA